MTNPVLHVQVNTPNNNHDNSLQDLNLDVASSTASVSLASSSSSTTSSSSGGGQWELQESLIPASSTTTTISTSQPQQPDKMARVLQYKFTWPQSNGSFREAAEHAWFPATQQQEQLDNRLCTTKWRQCRYRRRVGQGQDCYERVREAALEWQFNPTTTQQQPQPQQQHANKGILPVPSRDNDSSSSHQSSSSCFSLDQHASQHVQPLWSGPHNGASRRLVTFTTCGFKTKWLPKLYTMNPVMVVYDVLDQRYVFFLP